MRADLGDLRVQPLRLTAEPIALARALRAERSLDTATLICLTGRWPAARAIIAWAPSAVVPDYAQADGPGWLGYQAYDEEQSWWGRFDVVLLQDAAGGWRLSGASEPAELTELAALIEGLADRPWPAPGRVAISDFTMTPQPVHLAAVEHAISAIRAGELFQVNVCARGAGRLSGDPLDLFAAGSGLRSDFAAYLQNEHGTVVSFSPELFVRRVGREVLSAPIKGTRSRIPGLSAAADPNALELAASGKDRAENVMITDLVRNDLSRVCQPGTVRTPALLQLRAGPGVWHLVSEVTGELVDQATDRDLLRATFPPGSVTGAPKIRARAMIAELEAERRGVFTGGIGYLELVGQTALNVAIRTFEFAPEAGRATGAGRRFELGVGGGITA
ncbi:MAG: aminodeoxychorismate synthase, partial [Frankiales bacterium]|nr:aminodeoxychorismate synthase [Frankiales bacterium]